MKFTSLATILTGVTACSISLLTTISVFASSEKYFCAQHNGSYYTFARLERGAYRLLRFDRAVSDTWTQEKRCAAVSRRFQLFYENENMNAIGAGDVNNEPVLCAVKNLEEEVCTAENTLVTLPRNSDAMEKAQELMDLRKIVSGIEIPVSGKGKLETYRDGTTYYNLEVLEQIVLEKRDELLIQEELIPITE